MGRCDCAADSSPWIRSHNSPSSFTRSGPSIFNCVYAFFQLMWSCACAWLISLCCYHDPHCTSKILTLWPNYLDLTTCSIRKLDSISWMSNEWFLKAIRSKQLGWGVEIVDVSCAIIVRRALEQGLRSSFNFRLTFIRFSIPQSFVCVHVRMYIWLYACLYFLSIDMQLTVIDFTLLFSSLIFSPDLVGFKKLDLILWMWKEWFLKEIRSK